MLRALSRQRDVRSQAICIRCCGGLQEVGIVSSKGGRQGLEWVSRGNLCKISEGTDCNGWVSKAPSLSLRQRAGVPLLPASLVSSCSQAIAVLGLS